MEHRVFVYGTLLSGEVNHHLMDGAELLGAHRTEPRFTLFHLGAYPGAATGGSTAIAGEIYRLDGCGMERLDRLEDYPRLYDRTLIPSPYGRTWIYVYRGRIHGRPIVRSGDWRTITRRAGSFRAAAVRTARDPKNLRWRERFA